MRGNAVLLIFKDCVCVCTHACAACVFHILGVFSVFTWKHLCFLNDFIHNSIPGRYKI